MGLNKLASSSLRVIVSDFSVSPNVSFVSTTSLGNRMPFFYLLLVFLLWIGCDSQNYIKLCSFIFLSSQNLCYNTSQ